MCVSPIVVIEVVEKVGRAKKQGTAAKFWFELRKVRPSRDPFTLNRGMTSLLRFCRVCGSKGTTERCCILQAKFTK